MRRGPRADQPGWLRLDLEPLTPAESGQLVDTLLGSSGLPAAVRDRVGTAAEGNPLFVEQLVGMLVDDGFIVLGGPLEGDRDVLHVVTAQSEQAIRDTLAQDPWSKNEMLSITSIEQWTILLDGRH